MFGISADHPVSRVAELLPVALRHTFVSHKRTWRDLKRHHLAHQTFKDGDDLAATIRAAVEQLNTERMMPHPCGRLESVA